MDATLVDITDETWGVLMCHGLPNSHSLIDRRPALASALLVKRGSSTDGDGQLVCMSISTLLAPRYHEPLLRWVLIMYRGLGMLARFKGVVDSGSVLPWHIAAAIKAQEALSALM